ncbi:MAG: hypothetical protein WBM24_13060 [Candidatus Sulfotelmatobacter sp.]
MTAGLTGMSGHVTMLKVYHNSGCIKLALPLQPFTGTVTLHVRLFGRGGITFNDRRATAQVEQGKHGDDFYFGDLVLRRLSASAIWSPDIEFKI